jgi:hypothetical protein
MKMNQLKTDIAKLRKVAEEVEAYVKAELASCELSVGCPSGSDRGS